MKTTIYELLGMIKDNKAPKKIKYKDKVYIFDEEEYEYYEEKNDNSNGLFVDLFSTYIINSFLNNEVTILETTITFKQDTIKKVDEPYESVIFKTDYEFATELEKKIIDNIELIRKKQDEIIDKLNGE